MMTTIPDSSHSAIPASGDAESATFRHGRFVHLYGSSPAMLTLYDQIDKVAQTNAPVLIIGDSGTGKEMIARSIHEKSRRSGNAFIPVNCGAIPPNLIEAALFGHEKGSFTGAVQQQIGYFEHATGGTILLDEITEMAPAMQVKLLRVLETGAFHRVGGMEQIQVNVRILAATNRDPHVAVQQASFREDLLYRLAVFPLWVPSLKDRAGDIELLAQHFLDEFNQAGKTDKRFSRNALDLMRTYNWPGNVRELKNAVHRAYILAEKQVEVADPYRETSQTQKNKTVIQDGQLTMPIGTPLAVAQREIILATVKHFADDKRDAAKALGISLKTLYNRLESYQESRDSSYTTVIDKSLEADVE